MIIGIESAWGDQRLSGPTRTFDELRDAMQELLKTHDERAFPAAFCAAHGYRELPYSEGYAAYVLDLDTHRVIVPYYSFPRELDGAKVLYHTDRGEFRPVYYIGGEIAHRVAYLAICKYEADDNYYLFHCDESLQVVADDCFRSLEICKQLMDDSGASWHEMKAE